MATQKVSYLATVERITMFTIYSYVISDERKLKTCVLNTSVKEACCKLAIC